MGRSRFGQTIIIASVVLFAVLALVLMVMPHAGKVTQYLPLRQTKSNQLWFNETLETNIDTIHDKRRYIMREVCRNINSSNNNKATFNIQPEKFYNIYVNDEYKFLYCSVPKVACSNWKRALLSVLGVDNVANIPNSDLYDKPGKYYSTMKRMQLNMYTKAEVEFRLKHYTKFIFVREPFERILSAWRNKFTVASNVYFQSKWGKYIVEKYRDNPTKDAVKKGNDVTYKEFVQFLLNPKTMEDGMHNDHWQPYETLCYPCIVDYDYIGKYRSMDADIQYIMDKLQVKTMKFPERSVRYHHKPTVNFVEQEYAKIPIRDIHQIYENYKNDFAVFGYQYNNFGKFEDQPPKPPVQL